MKLSEAIRVGSMLRPQCFGDYFKGSGTCAMGAAADAFGLSDVTPDFCRRFPILESTGRTCPCGCRRYAWADMETVIIHLNDDMHWTREQIADWVEGQEKRIEAEASKEAEVLEER